MVKEQIPRSPRYPSNFGVTVRGSHGISVLGKVRNVSLTGILFVPDEENVPIVPNAEVQLQIYVSNGNSVTTYTVPMRVARFNRTEAGMAVDEKDEQATKAMRAIVEHASKDGATDQ